MNDRINIKYVVLFLIVMAALFFAVGASNFGKLQSNGRFQLVVRHTNNSAVYVIDTATGQVWSNSYVTRDGAEADLYKAKISHQ